MSPHKHALQLLSTACLLSAAGLVHAVTIIDPGFESYTISPGGFTRDAGPWTFGNDAGVVEPFALNSSTGLLNTWSATFAAIEGNQYASTYASLDTVTQLTSISATGEYIFKVQAAAPSGSVTILPGGVPMTLTTGTFSFFLDGNRIGSFSLLPGTDWTQFSIMATISAGTHTVGLINTAVAPYFINYDAFSLTAVPIPATVWLLGSGLLGLLGLTRKNQSRM